MQESASYAMGESEPPALMHLLQIERSDFRKCDKVQALDQAFCVLTHH